MGDASRVHADVPVLVLVSFPVSVPEHLYGRGRGCVGREIGEEQVEGDVQVGGLRGCALDDLAQSRQEEDLKEGGMVEVGPALLMAGR